jgi:hypothetical protein
MVLGGTEGEATFDDRAIAFGNAMVITATLAVMKAGQ